MGTHWVQVTNRPRCHRALPQRHLLTLIQCPRTTSFNDPTDVGAASAAHSATVCASASGAPAPAPAAYAHVDLTEAGTTIGKASPTSSQRTVTGTGCDHDAPDLWSARWTHFNVAALSRCQRQGAHLAMATAANASASAAETSSDPDGDCRHLATHDGGRPYRRCDAPDSDGGSEHRLRMPAANCQSEKTAAACGRAD